MGDGSKWVMGVMGVMGQIGAFCLPALLVIEDQYFRRLKISTLLMPLAFLRAFVLSGLYK